MVKVRQDLRKHQEGCSYRIVSTVLSWKEEDQEDKKEDQQDQEEQEEEGEQEEEEKEQKEEGKQEEKMLKP